MSCRRVRLGLFALTVLFALFLAGCTGLSPEESPIGRAQLSPDGSRLAYVLTDSRVVVRSVPEGDVLYRSSPRERFSEPALSTTGRFVVYTVGEEERLVWADAEGDDQATLEVGGRVNDWALRQDGGAVVLSTAARMTPDDDDPWLDVFLWTPMTGDVKLLTQGDLTWGHRALFDGRAILFEGGSSPQGWGDGGWYRIDPGGDVLPWMVPGLEQNETFFDAAQRSGGRWLLSSFISFDEEWCPEVARLAVWDPETRSARCFLEDAPDGVHRYFPCAHAPDGTHVIVQKWFSGVGGGTVALLLWDPEDDGFDTLVRFDDPIRMSVDCSSGGGRVSYEEILSDEDHSVIRVVDVAGRPVMTIGG